MGAEHREGDSPILGVVEVAGVSPTKNFIALLAEGVINGRDPTPTVPFSELIPTLKKIEDEGGSLSDYIEELEQRAKTENNNNGRISSAIEKIRGFARHDNVIIVDGYQVGSKTTAIVAAASVLMVGAGIFLRLDHAPTKPRVNKEEPESAETPDSNQE